MSHIKKIEKTIEKISLGNIGKRSVVVLPLDEYEEMKEELEMFRLGKIAQNTPEIEHKRVSETAILKWSQEAKKQKKEGKLGHFHELVKKEYPALAKKHGIA